MGLKPWVFLADLPIQCASGVWVLWYDQEAIQLRPELVIDKPSITLC